MHAAPLLDLAELLTEAQFRPSFVIPRDTPALLPSERVSLMQFRRGLQTIRLDEKKGEVGQPRGVG